MRRILSLALSIIMLFSISACGKSMPETVTDMKEATTETLVTETTEEPNEEIAIPSESDMDTIAHFDTLARPEDDSYLSSYENMYIYGSSVSLMTDTDTKKGVVECGIVAGEEVTVIAKQKGAAFILYEKDGVRYGGWVPQDNLNYNNPRNEPEPVTSDTYEGIPGPENIEKCGQSKSILMPIDKEYLPVHHRMYVVPDKAEVTSNPKSDEAHLICVLKAGSVIDVIAQKENSACILYPTDQGTKAGWVMKNVLSFRNPMDNYETQDIEKKSGEPGEHDITELGLEKSIQMPETNAYVNGYDMMYTVGAKSFITDKTIEGHTLFTIDSNTSVLVIAVSNEMALILYNTDFGTKAGWIPRSCLRYNCTNTKVRETSVEEKSGTPCDEDIKACSQMDSVGLPKEYNTSYNRMYIIGGDVQVNVYYKEGKSCQVCTIAEGSEVNVLAYQNKVALIMFECDAGTKCGWVDWTRLRYDKPRSTYTATEMEEPTGKPGPETIYNVGMEKCMTMPEDVTYYDSYQKMYTASNSNPIYSFYGNGVSLQIANEMMNSVVYAFAESKTSKCILFNTDQGIKAGWIPNEYLSLTPKK